MMIGPQSCKDSALQQATPQKAPPQASVVETSRLLSVQLAEPSGGQFAHIQVRLSGTAWSDMHGCVEWLVISEDLARSVSTRVVLAIAESLDVRFGSMDSEIFMDLNEGNFDHNVIISLPTAPTAGRSVHGEWHYSAYAGIVGQGAAEVTMIENPGNQ